MPGTGITETLTDYEDRVALAAINGPTAVVISGDEDAVLAVADIWRERGARPSGCRSATRFTPIAWTDAR